MKLIAIVSDSGSRFNFDPVKNQFDLNNASQLIVNQLDRSAPFDKAKCLSRNRSTSQCLIHAGKGIRYQDAFSCAVSQHPHNSFSDNCTGWLELLSRIKFGLSVPRYDVGF